MYSGMFGRRVSPPICLRFVILQFLLYAEAGGELYSLVPSPSRMAWYEASVESTLDIIILL